MAAATAEFDDFLARSAEATEENADAYLEEGQSIIRIYGTSRIERLDFVRKRIDKLRAMIPKLDSFFDKRAEITKACGLRNPRTAHFGKAVRLWRVYRGKLAEKEEQWKVDGELKTIGNWAREDAHRLHRTAKREIEAGNKERAVEMIRKELPRFKGTASQADLEAMFD